MTKLEELTSVLVNEINDFNQSVTKLEKIKEQLQTIKIKMEVSEYKSILEKHQKRMESHLDAMKGFENRFGKQLQKAKTYVTWVVVVFIVVLLLCFGSLFYAYQAKFNSDTIENVTHEKDIIDINMNYASFFENNAKS